MVVVGRGAGGGGGGSHSGGGGGGGDSSHIKRTGLLVGNFRKNL